MIFLCSISSIVNAAAQNIDIANLESKNKLYVSYANNTAPGYEVSVSSDTKYTVSQSYSWVRDQTSRYNLVSYSIDEGKQIPIVRQARGNFTLDITMETLHAVVFVAVPQYPIDVSEFDVIFSPPSPTNDNWFDAYSEITVSAPNTKEIEKGKQRAQLTGWSIDGSDLRTIPRTESGMFTTPTIHMSSSHKLDFTYVTQYNLEIVSQYGTVTGGGWHDKESTATVSVKAPDEFLVRHIFSGWEGSKIKPNGQSATVLMDSPKIIVAAWTTDYGQLAVLGIIPAAVAGFVILRKRQRQTPSAIETQPEVSPTEARQDTSAYTEAKQQFDENYTKEIDEYILQKSIEKLDSMHSRGLLDETRYAQIKERLEKET